MKIHRVLQVPDRSDLQEPHERQESKVAEDMHLIQGNDQMNSLTIEKQGIASGPRRKSAADSPADYRTGTNKKQRNPVWRKEYVLQMQEEYLSSRQEMQFSFHILSLFTFSLSLSLFFNALW